MPQASQETLNRFHWAFGAEASDAEALEWLLSRGYTNSGGWLSPPKNHDETPKDGSAIDYLCEEWDYACR